MRALVTDILKNNLWEMLRKYHDKCNANRIKHKKKRTQKILAKDVWKFRDGIFQTIVDERGPMIL